MAKSKKNLLLFTLYHIWKDQKRKHQPQKQTRTIQRKKNWAQKELSIFLLHLEIPLYINKPFVEKMRQFICVNTSSRILYLFMVTDCRRNQSGGLTSPDCVSKEVKQGEQIPPTPDKATGRLEKLHTCNKFPWWGDCLSEKYILFVSFILISTVTQKDFGKRKKISKCRYCEVFKL